MSEGTAAWWAATAPKCPLCKCALAYRPPARRFIEDDRYVECARGHVYELALDEAPDTPDDPAEVERWRNATPRELGEEVAALVEAMARARAETLETDRGEVLRHTRGEA